MSFFKVLISAIVALGANLFFNLHLAVSFLSECSSTPVESLSEDASECWSETSTLVEDSQSSNGSFWSSACPIAFSSQTLSSGSDTCAGSPIKKDSNKEAPDLSARDPPRHNPMPEMSGFGRFRRSIHITREEDIISLMHKHYSAFSIALLLSIHDCELATTYPVLWKRYVDQRIRSARNAHAQLGGRAATYVLPDEILKTSINPITGTRIQHGFVPSRATPYQLPVNLTEPKFKSELTRKFRSRGMTWAGERVVSPSCSVEHVEYQRLSSSSSACGDSWSTIL